MKDFTLQCATSAIAYCVSDTEDSGRCKIVVHLRQLCVSRRITGPSPERFSGPIWDLCNSAVRAEPSRDGCYRRPLGRTDSCPRRRGKKTRMVFHRCWFPSLRKLQLTCMPRGRFPWSSPAYSWHQQACAVRVYAASAEVGRAPAEDQNLFSTLNNGLTVRIIP